MGSLKADWPWLEECATVAVPTFATWVLILDMLLGRLEIYTVIILLVPRFYKK